MNVNIKRCTILLMFLFGAAWSVAAEQLTTVAVVDMEQVLNQFFSESQAVRAWRSDVEAFDEQRREIETEITDLEDQRLAAVERGNDTTALRLEGQIDERRSFLTEFVRIRRAQLERQREALLAGDDQFFRELDAALAFVAQNEGYTLIVDSEQRGLLWFSDQVDVTQMVVSRLREVLE